MSDRPVVEERTLVERANAALKVAARYGALDPEEELMLLASGVPAGKVQKAYLDHAATLALVSIAESLDQIAGHLAGA